MWSQADPTHLIGTFTPDGAPPKKTPRLFSKQRNQVELEIFCGKSNYEPMDGSHRCHQPYYINPNHVVFETSKTNISRNRCATFAQELRHYAFEVPSHCRHHQPPYLPALAALTAVEAFYVQFSVLCRAKDCPRPETSFAAPHNHPYDTFEHELPLSFASCSVIPDDADLVDNEAESVDPESLRSPTFYCYFCHVKSFKRISAYWFHIRDRHGRIPDNQRLAEIRRTGEIWAAHLEAERIRGHGVSHEQRTMQKLQQILAPDFTWDVVKTWKLRYHHER
ncbi:hypothetical protein ABEF95_000981 [Exophiala dermatitidis]